ncbi:MAG: aldose 1-epimerase family protein [Bacteroidota bacterium]
MNNYKNKIGNHHQLGGIETSILDNGLGKGSRIAWINTGAGLRYKVLIDRAMDIGDAFYNEHSLAWISALGVTPPQTFSGKGLDWLRTFGGGLLTTCGLDHVGGPETDDFGERGIHGLISNIPAEIVSIIQPDLPSGNLEMSITGIMRQVKIFGPCYQLKRTISGKLGEPFLQIHDEVMNVGNIDAPHMLLYHFNFGWPLADEGSEIFWKGKITKTRGNVSTKLFEKNDGKILPNYLPEHAGVGEEVAFIEVEGDKIGKIEAGIFNHNLNFGVKMHFQKDQLPWLTNWQHLADNEYVTGIEPGTNPPIGQVVAREEGTLIFLKPGEKKVYDLKLDIITENI